MRVIRLASLSVVWTLAVVAVMSSASAQTTPDSVEGVLAQPVQPGIVTSFQIQQYLMQRIPKLRSPVTSAQWKENAEKIQKHTLDDVIYHGWRREWVDSPPRFQQTGVIETGKGYRLRKFRYEVVPHVEATAILYEPERINGRAPAIVNLLGHEPMGNAAEYEQKRCINFAKRGIVALSLGWIGFGDLAKPGNGHDDAAYLDLVGSNAAGFFYLEMRRGLDYLASLPEVDPARLGVTGLSGGGWQTTVLSALDGRVAVSAEVAGFGSLEHNLTHPVDTDEVEEDATDLVEGQDYPDFVALRAPRPTLLMHNAEDNCCFRANLVKPYIYDQVRPFFRLYGQEDALQWHENRDPGTHNYQRDNREQAYRFFTEYFHMPATPEEIPGDDEIKSPQELAVGLSDNSLTISGLAKELADQISHPVIPTGQVERDSWVKAQRETLKSVVRYKPVSVANAWRMESTKQFGFESLSYRLDFSNRLSATGVWLKAISTPANAPVTILLNDKGYKATAEVASEHINRGEQVLALDVLFNGATLPAPIDPTDWELLTASMGERPLGIEAAQLLATAKWLETNTGQRQLRVETNGIRNQVIGLVAAALDPESFSEVMSRNSMDSLAYLIDAKVPYRSAPELFCLDLYKDFDLDPLAAIASPTRIARTGNPVK
jgi:dienelactone hydrolase